MTAVLLATLPAQALAQEPRDAARSARVQGVVVLESTWEAIIGATVSVVGTDVETQTGALGDFAILDAPLGEHWIRVSAPGLPSVRERIDVTENGIVFLQFRMPEDVSAVLDEVIIRVTDPDVASAEAKTALDLLAIKIPSINRRFSGNVGDNSGAVRLRGYNSLEQNGNPLIIIDNVAMTMERPPLEILAEIPAADVESIEVLRGPLAALRYPYAANGVIKVTTTRGARGRR
jgi:outer membrane receptor protein involved in Fe transport